MTSVDVVAMEPGAFGVQVHEAAGVETSHRVHITDDYLDDLGLSDVPAEDLVRETFLFLLEREPATAILGEFTLREVEDHFPEYRDEIVSRVGATSAGGGGGAAAGG